MFCNGKILGTPFFMLLFILPFSIIVTKNIKQPDSIQNTLSFVITKQLTIQSKKGRGK